MAFSLSPERCNQEKKQPFQVIMLEENKVRFSKLQDFLIHYSKVFFNIVHFKITKFRHLSLMLSLLFLNA